ncbi:hypothetical protein A4R35_17935 [Thermogemmatispora tikiterensis]|uniref:Uncharacterized protein n=1 Tax=Thermogemmatispora tikiterensis TaxID=1825093 RepID=A0A328VP23_9CHLR|nr:hypothetical protein A4R35_17935 [Thermogemmatispora tikiterensis]
MASPSQAGWLMLILRRSARLCSSTSRHLVFAKRAVSGAGSWQHFPWSLLLFLAEQQPQSDNHVDLAEPFSYLPVAILRH